MAINISDLKNKIDSQLLRANMKKKANIVIAAANDWPTSVETLEEYISEVEKFIDNISSKKNIETALKKIDFSKNSWESESLTQILDIFQYYEPNSSLNEIVKDFEKEN